jgi:hypothetical protein
MDYEIFFYNNIRHILYINYYDIIYSRCEYSHSILSILIQVDGWIFESVLCKKLLVLIILGL